MSIDHSDVEVALSAAAAGAAAVRRRYGTDLAQLAKSPTDFATEADLAAEEAIHRVIAAARPSDGFQGEETGTTAGRSDRRWLVDPLCGTLNFAAATPLATVNVALDTPFGVTAAVSADPIAEEFFWTDGSGAWVRHGDADRPLEPFPRSLIVDVNCDGKRDASFVGAQLIAEYDKFVRTLLTGHHVGLLSGVAMEGLLNACARKIRGAFAVPQGYHFLNVDRSALQQGTANASRARQVMGEVPEDVINGAHQAPLAPHKVRFPEEAAKHLRLKPVDTTPRADSATPGNDDVGSM